MRGLTGKYVLQRFLMYLLTIWLGGTLVFIIPRLAPGDPVTAMVTRLMMKEGYVENADKMIEAWKVEFGLNDSIFVQYIRYLKNITRLDFGYSLSRFPTKAMEMIKVSLPWSISLLLIATIFSFLIGITIGSLMGWKRTPKWAQSILPVSLTFSAIPYFMFGILLIFLFGFWLKWLPTSGGYGWDVIPGFNAAFIKDVISHGILPLLSIVLTSMGGWALGMRGLMISVNNEDYQILAEAKGLSSSRIFFRYGVRNAILPVLTALAMGLGGLISGSTLVEFIFAYPGTGYMLFQAIGTQDFAVIQAICNLMIMITATGVFLIDLLYPLIDPRITYKKT